ncbi:methyltransferase domain-containing protein [Marinovum sp. 2_MG-2023]|uniref:methyltransferase domain-containing protein n=1 Tax=unclassified Marinovum TaxID=2647166 RepID=UPI0026E1CD31|nr:MULTISPECIES: methyltransferase domain-containing protein [unclassified Marinovum]MDO6730574.1 methyltransferase domain-containing protein [Marinovum sp. 2_MG-2023]MDO6778724.1 methyltransferase domain-containing protein [Marinovum sp. 1_MG-2023]
MQPRLTDPAALIRNRRRASLDALFLFESARDDLEDRLSLVKRTFTAPAIVTGQPEIWGNLAESTRIVADDDTLPLEPGAHDAILHSHSLHWANDPVGQLIQCRRALKPDGFFLASLFGGQTLQELRACLASAETELTGGLSPRIAPMAEIRDMGALLQRAGFALPVADAFRLTVTYETPLHLMRELRAMGEGNALDARLRRPTRRAVLLRAAELYSQLHAQPDGRIPATFEFIVLTGWAPDDSQPKPLRPGSAKARLADALKVPETKLKD